MLRILFLCAFFLSAFFPYARAVSFQKSSEKIIVIVVTEKDQALIGKDSFSTDSLISELKQGVWKSYTATGKMQDALVVKFSSKLSATTCLAIVNTIIKAQQEALIYSVSAASQKKIRRII